MIRLLLVDDQPAVRRGFGMRLHLEPDIQIVGEASTGKEALSIGLANRLSPRAGALNMAIELAQELARFPQLCLRSDRLSSYEQWSLPLNEALHNETRRGLQVINSGETREGARRFTAGHGRHGSLADI